MALHRDIYWVGRQWAVTGFGIQAIDQRLKGAFDVEAAKVWEDDLPQRMRALAWLNADDFDKALDLARARSPAPPRKKGLPLVESVLELIQPAGTEPPQQPAPPPVTTNIAQPDVADGKPPTPAPLPAAMDLPRELPPQKSGPLVMRIEHVSAKFLPRWRIRHGGP